MMTSTNVQQIVTGDQSHAPTLNATILYEDLSTGMRANVLFNRIIRQLDLRSDSEVELLRMDLLGNSMVKMLAERAAAESGLVIISSHGQDSLSANVENWIKQWLESKKSSPLAMVLLLDRNPGDQPENNPIIARLKNLAGENKVECFSYFFDSDDTNRSFQSSRIRDWGAEVSFGNNFGEENHQRRFWGINE
jgi:hypothetical protein